MYDLTNLNHKELLLAAGLSYSMDRGGSGEMTGERSPKSLHGDSGCRCWVPKLSAKHTFAVALSQVAMETS